MILQVFPNEHYPHPWGDRNISGNVGLYRIDQYILLYLKDLQRLRIANNNGTDPR
ncbi:MAG: hypothetical protein U5N26_02380 [Candidatus Marinimicrobia bacterium]|nr:hypothetical protein [Candidatus Neomarinimicrobiota bacterium]